MFMPPPLRKRLFLSALVDLVGFQSTPTLRRSVARAAQRRDEEALDRMCPHLLDDLGLRSGDSCVTDWGLVEAASRMRNGRY